MRCGGAKDKSSPKSLVEAVHRVFNFERCEREATVQTPLGPRCAECAKDLEAAAKSDKTILGIALKARRDRMN